MSQGLDFGYRRLLVELALSASDPETLRSVAQFARLLGLELHGLFIEDEALLALADLPFAREIRLPTHEWGPMDAGRLEHELQQQANLVRRRLEAAVQALGMTHGFEVLRGDPGACLAERSCATDIIVIAPADAAGTRSLRTSAQVHEAAYHADAATLLLPPRPHRQRGAVVVVLADPADPNLETAARIAVAGEERLLVLVPAVTETAAVIARTTASGLSGQRITVRSLAGLQPEDVMAALGGEHERLIVMTGGAEPAGGIDAASRIVALRHSAVLMVPPRGRPRLATAREADEQS
ncbi:MAG: hypothetical protein P4L71_18305 [Acetobacteraceae bacterium]|nr:hypothetical protein [Acetobacteraceae bacterium]